jgi:hypothetical protein
MTDWIDKSDSSQFRSDFEQGWKATKKAKLGCKQEMRVLEFKRCFSMRIVEQDFLILTVCWCCAMISKISTLSMCISKNCLHAGEYVGEVGASISTMLAK